jgi:hypothetical protein
LLVMITTAGDDDNCWWWWPRDDCYCWKPIQEGLKSENVWDSGGIFKETKLKLISGDFCFFYFVLCAGKDLKLWNKTNIAHFKPRNASRSCVLSILTQKQDRAAQTRSPFSDFHFF